MTLILKRKVFLRTTFDATSSLQDRDLLVSITLYINYTGVNWGIATATTMFQYLHYNQQTLYKDNFIFLLICTFLQTQFFLLPTQYDLQ